MNLIDVKSAIRAAAISDDTVLIEGLHGIGKSAAAAQIAFEDDYHMETLFLSHQEVGDLIGMPTTINGVTSWTVPIWLDRMNKSGKKCILFLDELNRAPLDVRQSAMQLVLERRIHEHELPPFEKQRCLVIAAINPADEYQVDEMDAALLDRFLYITVDADAPAWVKWASNENISPEIIDFVSEFPDLLHYVPKDGSFGASPRSWAKLSDYLYNSNVISHDIMFQIMKGKLGMEVASQFYSFYSDYNNVVKLEDVISLIDSNTRTTGDIEHIADKVKKLIQKVQVPQKINLAHRLSELKDKLYVLVFLYATDVEITVAILKDIKSNDVDEYNKIVLIDKTLNNKELFKRIVNGE